MTPARLKECRDSTPSPWEAVKMIEELVAEVDSLQDEIGWLAQEIGEMEADHRAELARRDGGP